MVNIKQPSLQHMINILNKNLHVPEERLQVMINKQGSLKSLVFRHPVMISKRRVDLGVHLAPSSYSET
jgi:hypothetical protein